MQCWMPSFAAVLALAVCATAHLNDPLSSPPVGEVWPLSSPPDVPPVGEVWPHPKYIERGRFTLNVDLGNLQFRVKSYSCPSLDRAIQRTVSTLQAMPRPAHSKPKTLNYGEKNRTLNVLVIDLLNPCEDLPYLYMDESYTLQITSDGYGSNMTADTIWGAIHGLETFTQLVVADGGQLSIMSTHIADQPRFAFRGFMIDTSRHYLPVSTIKEMLDLMSMNKFNVLHWHIVDSQSFPYQSDIYPNLSAKGAWTGRHVYTAQDMASVVQHATDRGIRVLPEFDTPGHTASWGLGQPGLLTPCYSAGAPDGSFGPLDPTVASNYEFLAILLAEVTQRFPDHYLHLGGDEVPFGCWKSNPSISGFMAANNISDYQALEEYYFSKLLPLVKALPQPRGYLVWQEVFDNGVRLANDTVVHIWKNENDLPNIQIELAKVTAAGYQTVLSSCYYLNYIAYGVDWHKFYECDPQVFEGSDEQKDLVVGGEACMWGEYVDRTNLVARSFPRASAVAEKLWSPAEVTGSAAAAEARLESHRCRMYNRGHQVEPLAPGYCDADLL